jgi:hypothetical protein
LSLHTQATRREKKKRRENDLRRKRRNTATEENKTKQNREEKNERFGVEPKMSNVFAQTLEDSRDVDAGDHTAQTENKSREQEHKNREKHR